MLEIQSKQMQPDIVVLQLTGRMTLGRQCKQLEWRWTTWWARAGKKLFLIPAA